MSDQQQEKVKGVVDLVFLMDATGSMDRCIDALKINIEMFIDLLTATDANNACIVKDWRGKVVGYRDFECDSNPFEDKLFVRDAGALKSQLSSLKATGGGDEPEGLLDAIYKVADMGSTAKGEEDSAKWRYRSDAARVVIVFTDASYKPTMFLSEARGGTLNDVVNKVHAERIVLSIFAPDMPCYDELAAIDKCEFEPVGSIGDDPQMALVEFTSDKANFRNTLEQLAKSVSKSASTPTI